MSISNTTTKQSFIGDGSLTDFDFTISFFDGESGTVIKVYVDGTLQASGYTINEDSADSDGICPGGTVVFSSPPADGAVILVQRESARTQASDFSGTTFPAGSVESTLDRAIMVIQELDEQGTNEDTVTPVSSSSTNTIPDWETATEYALNETVYVTGEGGAYEDKLYRCISAHTSNSFATDFGNSKWEQIVVAGAQGATGPSGPTGAQGVKGDKGDAGANGADGADGIFSEIASQGEAQTGTNNTKGMSPLRVKEAIAFQVPNLTAINDLEEKDSTQDTTIAELTSRVNILEGVSPTIKARGKQRINNGQAVALELDAASGQAGEGNAFELDADGANSAIVTVEIRRKTDSEFRAVIVTMRLHYIDGTWYLGRDSTTILAGGNPDGVTFSVDTVDNVAVVKYVSDTMSGTYDNSESYAIWLIEEVSKNF